MTTRGELEQVQSVNIDGVNTGEVTGESLELGVFVSVNKKGSLCELEARVSHLVLASTGSLALANSGEVT